MKVIKLEQAKEYSNSNRCKGLEYPLNNKDASISTASITGRYPEKGYCVNEKSKELIYVVDGNGSLNKKNEKLLFTKGDVIFIEKGEVFYWDGKCKLITTCFPAWNEEQHKIVD